jgi:hypothetical protein
MARAKLMPVLLLLTLTVGTLFGQEPEMTEAEFREGLLALARLGATNPFLKDSPDVYLEPRSLNQFFTDRIYQRLEGNAYFGYRWNEGFTCPEKAVSIEEIKDLTETTGAAYRRALEMSLEAEKYKIKPGAVCQIGLAIVGAETAETERTLPGVMVEAYFRNTTTKKSFFVRFGAGSPRGLAGAIQLSAEMLVAELEGFRGQE